MNLAIAARLGVRPTFVLQALGLSLLIAASAHVSVPFWPVPMTMQTLAVFSIAGIVGARLGVAAMLAVLLEGAVGLPVFASGVGVAVLVGPTAGYLVGMVLAAFLIGRATSALGQAGAIVLSTAVVYAFGAAWLARFVGGDKALALGVLPFLLGDVVKGLLAWMLVRLFARD